MKTLLITGIIIISGLLTSCSEEKPHSASKQIEFDKQIEVQIALRSKPYKSGDEINSGDFKIIRSVILSVPSESGPGHFACLSSGTMVEMKWDRTYPLPRGEKGILFEGFSWTIRNGLVDNGDRRTFGWYGPAIRAFTPEFEALVSPVSLGHYREEIDKAPVLIIRARLVDVRPKVPDIQLRG